MTCWAPEKVLSPTEWTSTHPAPHVRAAVQSLATLSLARCQVPQKITGGAPGAEEGLIQSPPDPLGLPWVAFLSKKHWHKSLTIYVCGNLSQH